MAKFQVKKWFVSEIQVALLKIRDLAQQFSTVCSTQMWPMYLTIRYIFIVIKESNHTALIQVKQPL